MQSRASSMPPASGSSPTNSFTSDGASDFMVSPRSSGPSRASMNAFCQSPSALPKAGLVCASTTAAATRGCLRQPLLDDHAADRMADENGPCRADLLQEILQRIRQRRDADVGERRRAAIARHVPGDRAIAIAESARAGRARPAPRRRCHAGTPAASCRDRRGLDSQSGRPFGLQRRVVIGDRC